MRKIATPFFCFFFLISLNCFSQQAKWAFSVGSNQSETARGITIDKFGNRIIAGYFTGQNVDFDPSPTASFYLSSAGSNDIFVAKYDSLGKFIKAFRIGGSNNDAALSVTTDTSGNVYITGWFRGQNIDFNPGPSVAYLNSNGDGGSDLGYDGQCFIAKYDNNLNYKWAFNVGGTTVNNAGLKIRFDSEGYLYVCGDFAGTNVNFNPKAGAKYLSSSSFGTRTSGFLAKYKSGGSCVWAKAFGGESGTDAEVRDFVFGSSKNIYLTGLYGGTINLNPGSTTANYVSSNGGIDMFVVKLNKSAKYLWGFGFGGTSDDAPWGMGIDNTNHIYITGDIQSSSVDFNPTSASAIINSNGGSDIFVAKYDQNGKYIFAQAIGGSGVDAAYDISVQSNEYVLTGNFSGVVNFNQFNATTKYLSSAGGTDIFAAHYSLQGKYLKGFRMGSISDDAGYALASNNVNEFSLCGDFQGSDVDFDPSSGQILLTSQGSLDAFVGDYLWSSPITTIANFSGFYDTKQKGVSLNWTTGSEIKYSSFEIQRADNLLDFQKIGNTNANENFSVTSGYQYIDNTPNDNNFYRLKEVDENGNFSYSKIINISSPATKYLKAYPNPVINNVNIIIPKEFQNISTRIQIINELGQIVIDKNYQQGINTNELNIKLNKLMKGIYIAKIIGVNGSAASLKIVKQ